MPKNHVIGDTRKLVSAAKDSGFASVQVGPLVGSGSKRYVLISDLEPVLDAAEGMVLTYQTAGNSLEILDSEGVVLATLSTTT